MKVSDRSAKCEKCGKNYKTAGNTSNLIAHLKAAHPACFKALEEADNADIQPSNTNTLDSMLQQIDDVKRKYLWYISVI